MVAALLLSCALAASGYSAIRASMKGAPSVLVGRGRPIPLRWLGGILLILSVAPVAGSASSALIGWVCWMFCVLPIAGMPLILAFPYAPKASLIAPPLIFLILSGLLRLTL